jgi:hypothetical protein
MIIASTISVQMRSGVRPRDWDGDLIREYLEGADGGPWDMSRYLLAFYHFWDLNQTEKALDAARKLGEAAQKTHAIASHRKVSLYESAMGEAAWGDLSAAALRFSEAEDIDTGGVEATKQRVLAFIRSKEDNKTEALAALKASRKALLRQFKTITPTVQAELDWLTALESKLADDDPAPAVLI